MFKKYINEEIETFIRQKLKQHKFAYIFLDSIQVIVETYPAYKQIIESPIDLNIINQKAISKNYSSTEEFRNDILTMIDNCIKFNQGIPKYIEASTAYLTYFNNNFEKVEGKIVKNIKKEEENIKKKLIESNIKATNHSQIKNKIIPVISNNSEEDVLTEKISNLLFKNINEMISTCDYDIIHEVSSSISKNIIKKTVTFDIIYDDFVKFLNSNLKNKDNKEVKSKIQKKFRKIYRDIKEEQKVETSKLVIKINSKEESKVLGEVEYKKLIDETAEILEEFLESQKIPEVYRENEEYPMDPSLKKRINEVLSCVEKRVVGVYSCNGDRLN